VVATQLQTFMEAMIRILTNITETMTNDINELMLEGNGICVDRIDSLRAYEAAAGAIDLPMPEAMPEAAYEPKAQPTIPSEISSHATPFISNQKAIKKLSDNSTSSYTQIDIQKAIKRLSENDTDILSQTDTQKVISQQTDSNLVNPSLSHGLSQSLTDLDVPVPASISNTIKSISDIIRSNEPIINGYFTVVPTMNETLNSFYADMNITRDRHGNFNKNITNIK
jgi:hypothetical protein